MSAPLHTRPFNREHAKAGAPYCCENGDGATIHKWDCRGAVPLAGIVSGPDSDYPSLWSASGNNHNNWSSHLAMTPLGMIDGKPFFVGDAIEVWDLPDTWEKMAAEPHHRIRHEPEIRWPAPDPVYPETRMTFDDAIDVIDRCNSRHGIAITEDQVKAIANAAIRRAIEDGQVVDAETEIVVMGRKTRAARDMAIAEAVSAAYMRALYTIPGADGIDLKAIVAGVAP